MVVSASASFHRAGCPCGTVATGCGADAAPSRAKPAKAAFIRENHSRTINLSSTRQNACLRAPFLTLSEPCAKASPPVAALRKNRLGRPAAEFPAPYPDAPRLLELAGLRHPPAL